MNRPCSGLALGAALAVWLPCVGTAHAFRNPDFFAADATRGGGGGKYFTTSRAEGYGCAVCHSRGDTVPVQVQNLPLDGFVPGQRYRITIDWPDDLPSVALNLELTNYDAAPFGQLETPDPLVLSDADRCREGDPASTGQQVITDANGRHVMLVAECGQAQTSFDWIAPNTPEPGYFSASLTFSDRNNKLTGDQVVDLAWAFGPIGADKPSTNAYNTRCALAPQLGADSAHDSHSTQLEGMITLACALAFLIRRNRRAVLTDLRAPGNK